MTLELTVHQIGLMRTALDTRLQRIDSMLKIFKEDGHKDNDPIMVAYREELWDVKELYDSLTVL